MTRIIENTIEEFTIELLERLGYQYIYAPDLPVRCTQTGIAHDLPVRGTQTGGEVKIVENDELKKANYER